MISELKDELMDVKCVQVSSNACLEEAFCEIDTMQEFVEGMQVKGLMLNVVNTGTHPHSPKSPLPIKHQHSPPALPPPNITQGVSSSTLSPCPLISVPPTSMQECVPSPPALPAMEPLAPTVDVVDGGQGDNLHGQTPPRDPSPPMIISTTLSPSVA
ncbi:hypothetical protein SCLCIDRAFT_28992 [Scleroderma citrinum Foug A]|uniref:Uncharacterized protein n=1 Tax=Scleroderma citrinum Foug A TaxID=1036808 RepID=A0A0C3D968_9AGAM|nr:hypothetical protein SCLCIDRAFT_28992 [Scleroderma citrinum Foug A]